jgi:hypothetical protein
MTPFRDRYEAHARRIDALRRVVAEPLASYYAGYRAGMVRALAGADQADDAERLARDRSAYAAVAGDAGQDASHAAWGCGYHDGQAWWDPTQHRGLLRLAIRTASPAGSARAFAREVWDVDEGSVRQMLAGTRPVPADRYTQLLDLIGADRCGTGGLGRGPID